MERREILEILKIDCLLSYNLLLSYLLLFLSLFKMDNITYESIRDMVLEKHVVDIIDGYVLDLLQHDTPNAKIAATEKFCREHFAGLFIHGNFIKIQEYKHICRQSIHKGWSKYTKNDLLIWMYNKGLNTFYHHQ